MSSSVEAREVLRWPDVPAIRAALARLAGLSLDGLAWSELERRIPGFAADRPRSARLARDAGDLIAGGSHHTLAPATPFPLTFPRAAAPYVWDADDHRYIDFVQAGGATILGGGHRTADRVGATSAACGPATALPHPAEIELARLVRECMPAVERVRMTASGTEAVMAAVRIARAYTGAPHIVKIGGGYHGWSDSVVFGLRVPGTGRAGVHGIPGETLVHTHEAPPDDIGALRDVLVANAATGGTAAVLVEPLGPQSGTIPVGAGHHAAVAELAREFGALLVFDEVVTGFRLGSGGVQGHLGLRPDLTVLGKCLGGGYPAGAVGGRADVMATLTAGHPRYALVAGTLSANPVSCAAGHAALSEMRESDAAGVASRAGAALHAGLAALLAEYALPFVAYHFGSIVHLHTSGLFHLDPARPDFRAQAAGRKRMLDLFTVAAMAEGLLLPPTGRMFLTVAHTPGVVQDALARFARVFRALIA